MVTSDPEQEDTDSSHLLELLEAVRRPSNNHRRRNQIIIIIGFIAAIGLFFLFSYWHPFWRYQPGYVSEAQFGQDWPFTVTEGRVICLGAGEMVLETRAGIFGLTSHTIAIGYESLDESNIWKYDPMGWNQRVPADEFWIYINSLCK